VQTGAVQTGADFFGVSVNEPDDSAQATGPVLLAGARIPMRPADRTTETGRTDTGRTDTGRHSAAAGAHDKGE